MRVSTLCKISLTEKMEKKECYVDYYRVLECERTATEEEIKKNYKRLVLLAHPDKVRNENDDSFVLIQKAWDVLKDPVSRKQYDAELTCHEHNECFLYDTVSLSDMQLHSSEGVYSYPCRCGGTYLLSTSDSTTTNIVIGCDECSFSIQVNKI